MVPRSISDKEPTETETNRHEKHEKYIKSKWKKSRTFDIYAIFKFEISFQGRVFCRKFRINALVQ